MDRRKFLSGIALTSASLAVSQKSEATSSQATLSAGKPVIIASANGINGIDGGYALLQRGHDTLDAVSFVHKVQEDDPRDDSVGLGGLPNEDGEVELDASVMHGPSRRGGAVGGVRGIKNVSALARLVMERTNHLMLVGEGAERFAVAHGFPKENLLTEPSRKTWLLWKESHSDGDNWGAGISDPGWKSPVPVADAKTTPIDPRWQQLYEKAEVLGIPDEERLAAIYKVLYPPTGTVHCSVLNAKGEMSGGTSTSGLAWKIPGRVGDSPILGAGCWTDQEVGSAGATGTGEENIKVAGAHTIVENMRHGMAPLEAGMDALKRIVRNHNNDMKKLRFLSMTYYILRKDGAFAGVSLWSGPKDKPRRFCVHDGSKRLENCAALFEGSTIQWPPIVNAK